MPLYEYQCHACGHHFEALQKVSDAPLTQCPECKKKKVEKLVSAPGFQLKGSGWYVTDFRDKKDKPKAKEENATSSSAAKESPKKEKAE